MAEEYEQEDTPMEEAPEDLLEEDEIDDREEGFLKGYDDVDKKEKSDDVKEDEASPDDV